MKPIVAIVGRPNVGKSTLFNRIVGRRQAITHDVAGVTRDRHYGDAEWEGVAFTCVDTGGMPEGKTTLARQVDRQIDLAIQEADLLLFVLDGRAGLLPEEKAIALRLQKQSKPIFFVANKIDDQSHEGKALEFYALGTERVFPVSAEHSYRVNDLLDGVVAVIANRAKQSHDDHGIATPAAGGLAMTTASIRVALIGRPNVGKSSLFNRLIGEDRAVVHDEPGTTRDVINTVIQFGERTYTFLDTAGIRRKSRQAPPVERFSIFKTLKAMEAADLILLLMEAPEGVTKQDAQLASYACENHRGLIVLWNKWDLIQGALTKQKSLKEDKLLKDYVTSTRKFLPFADYAPIHCLSAKTGWGVAELWPFLPKLDEEMHRTITTSELNRALERVLALKEPPLFRNRPVRLYYGTQTGKNPVTLTFFANAPQGITPAYHRFMERQFRKFLELPSVPLRLRFRARNEK